MALTYVVDAHFVGDVPSHVCPEGQARHSLLFTYLSLAHGVAVAPSHV